MASISHCLNTVADICERASQEHFEDGMDSTFTQELDQAFRTFGAAIFIPLSLIAMRFDPNVVCEFLRWIGRIEDEQTIGCRRELLLIGLERQDITVRSSAALGIASMDDPFFIEPLRTVVELEICEEFQRDILQVLQQLYTTEQERGNVGKDNSP